jgi:hypothetical protein
LSTHDVTGCVKIAHNRSMTLASISLASRENAIFPFVHKCFTDNDFILTVLTNRVMQEIKRTTQNSSLQHSVTVACSSTAAIKEHGQSFQKSETGREISEASYTDLLLQNHILSMTSKRHLFRCHVIHS